MYRASLTGASFFFPEDNVSYYLPVSHRSGGNASMRGVRDVLRALRDTKGRAVAHSCQHELLAFKEHVDLHDSNLLDSLLVMWLLNEYAPGKSMYGLKALAKHHLGIEMATFKETTGGRSFDELTPEEGLDYACEDAECAYWLAEKFYPKLSNYPGMEEQLWNVEMPFVRVLRHMEDTGMEIDRDFLVEYADMLTAKLAPIKDDWEFISNGLNPNSSQQLQWFFKEGHWPTSLSEPTKGSVRDFYDGNYDAVSWQTGAEYLEAIARAPKTSVLGKAAAETRLEYMTANKLLGTYTQKMIYLADQYPDGRLHADANHTAAATGRISTSYPCISNIPTRTEIGAQLLRAFISPDDFLLMSSDYSQIELRVLAHLSGSGSLMDAYLEGRDVHQNTADLIGTDRDDGKTVNFSSVYGVGDKKMARKLARSRQEAKKVISQFWRSYSELEALKKSQVEFAKTHGYVVTLGNRIRKVENINSPNKWQRYGAERIAFNTPIQGGARDAMTKAMVDIYQAAYSRNWIQDKTFGFCNQIYDDILTYVHEGIKQEASALVKEGMENAYSLSVPLITEPVQGKCWKDVK